MALRIVVSSSRSEHLRAGVALSECLTLLGFPHAYIGGFAWELLGSRRPTQISISPGDASPQYTTFLLFSHDIDVLIQSNCEVDILKVREMLEKTNKHFIDAGLKLYYVKDPVAQGDVLTQLSMHLGSIVLVETLQTGTLGLPEVPEPLHVITTDEGSMPILHPSILILTKLKRWSQNRSSPRPLTKAKNESDKSDIEFLIAWMHKEGMKIDFEGYKGKPKDVLIAWVKNFKDMLATNGGDILLGQLIGIIPEADVEFLGA